VEIFGTRKLESLAYRDPHSSTVPFANCAGAAVPLNGRMRRCRLTAISIGRDGTGYVCVILRLAVLVELRLVTDGQTDTDTGPWLVPRMHSIAR